MTLGAWGLGDLGLEWSEEERGGTSALYVFTGPSDKMRSDLYLRGILGLSRPHGGGIIAAGV